MEDKIKVVLFPVFALIVVAACVYFLYQPIKNTIDLSGQNKQLTSDYEGLKLKLESLQREKQQQNNIEVDGSKVVYENPEFKFSKDASFAPLIEKFIDISKIAGVRIHAIDYNYAPSEDKVFIAQYAGYNVCELSVSAVGRYSNFQKLFETIIADANIMNLAEIDIKPWESDNSILVGKFKLRLYTKTM